MTSLQLLFIVVVFLAVMLALEGAYNAFGGNKTKEMKRISERLAMLDEANNVRVITLARPDDNRRFSGLQRWLEQQPLGHRLVLYVSHTGRDVTAAEILAMSAGGLAIGLLLSLVLGKPMVFGLVMGGVIAAVPWWLVSTLRDQHIRRMEQQLPEALDMMGRAMRAGHALNTAIKMCGDELQAPLGPEFRKLADEVVFGIPFTTALQNLADRIPLKDISYFIVAVTVQRETGGNMAELLDKISGLMRDRFKLMGEVRTLSAEGRMSAWVLGLLPFGIGGVMSLSNPGFVSVLWEDPAGLVWVQRAAVMMVLGVFWIRRIVRIRV